MRKLAVVYHSARGNTQRIAELIAAGAASVPAVQVQLLRGRRPDRRA